MKLNKGLTLVLALVVVTLLVTASFAQETTAGIQGIVKDPQGAVVSKAVVEVTSPALIGNKKVETDSSGYYRFANLPPGTYAISVTAQGFRTLKQSGVTLATGQLPTIDLKLEIGGVEQTVEVSSAAPIVDVSQSKVQTNITNDVLANVPKGRSFQSVIQFAPGARSEPLQGGYQIDGASNTENAYLVEGQETASGFDGHSAANVPMEFIQEVQVKSSGFEAEYGGALGGVVNVIQKRGSNAWHGSVFTYYEGDALDSTGARDNVWNTGVGTSQVRQLRKNPQVGQNAAPPGTTVVCPGPYCRLDQPTQFYQPKKDHYRYVTPGFEVGGYLVKDRLWLFTSFAPEIVQQARTVHFGPSGTPANTDRTFHYNRNTYYALSRLDYLLTQKIRVYGAWQYQYARSTGNTWPNADDAYGLYNPISGNNADSYNGGLGGTYPNVIYNTGADITLTPSLVATSRFGYFYYSSSTFGTPAGIRYFYRDTNYPYTTGNVPANLTTSTCTTPGCGNVALNGTTLNTVPNASNLVRPTGYFNFADNTSTLYDQWKKYSFNQDLAWFKKGFGTHNFKFGYAFNRGTNDILSGFNTAAVYVAYNTVYTPQTTVGTNNCAAIASANTTLFGSSNGCQGNWGTVNFRELGTTGKVGGNNHALYAQDAWTIGKGLTLNLGVRMDKEALPTYIAGFNGINFGWGDKVAPRLGASYDLLGNGKVKLYGSFGYFFDIMKYQLPRGSFGGDYWHDCVYAMDSPDITLLQPTRDSSGHYCPLGGGSAPANGTFPANSIRFIENVDFRQPANDPGSFGSLGSTGLVDPNLKPMKQHEMVVGVDWALTSQLAFETRYSRKRLDRTIEDAGIMTENGEQFYIVNPGEGINATLPSFECTTCPANPKAHRDYDGIEFRLTKRQGSSNWFGSLSYTYSRLYGNYSGLTATDISDGGGARNGANTDRAFDEPFMSYDSHGALINGPLATDRPNTFKAYGYYRLKWWHMESLIGAYQQLYSGTPLSTYVSVQNAPVFVEGRGKFADITRDSSGNWVLNGVSERRTPKYAQTDLSFIQEAHVSKNNEKLVLGFEANITNLFNQRSVTYINQNLIASSFISPDSWDATPSGIDYKSLLAGYNYITTANTEPYNFGTTCTVASPCKTKNVLNSMYGQPYGWQDGRGMRFKLKFTF
jgi:hypothetical protein